MIESQDDDWWERMAGYFTDLPEPNWNVPIVNGWKFSKTCCACPEQFEGRRDTGDAFLYFRSRHGTTTCCVADTLEHAIDTIWDDTGRLHFVKCYGDVFDDAACEMIKAVVAEYEAMKKGDGNA